MIKKFLAMPEVSERIKSLPKYLFAEIDELRTKKIEEGVYVIDLSIGDPDLPTHPLIVEKMREEVKDPRNHRYPSYDGDISLRKTFVDWYYERFGFSFSPSSALTLIGSKEGIAHFHLAFLNEGDISIVPSPAYPVYGIWTKFAGGKVYNVVLKEENGFLPDIENIPQDILSRAKIFWLCYPNNPTGACATWEFYEKVAFYAKKYDFVVAVDLAYSEIYFDNKKPLSFFQVVKDDSIYAIEFHSFSKTFSMTGWRIGMAVGNKDVVSALGKVKTNTDSGVFRAIQMAAKFALENYDKIVPDILKVYERRKRKIEYALEQAGISFFKSYATFYIWFRCGGSSKEFVKNALDKFGILLTPGIGFGEGGEGFVRISLTAKDEDIEKAAKLIPQLKQLM